VSQFSWKEGGGVIEDKYEDKEAKFAKGGREETSRGPLLGLLKFHLPILVWLLIGLSLSLNGGRAPLHQVKAFEPILPRVT
jgi:hypothetical protein